MKLRLIAIDPGQSGGIAWNEDDIVHAEPMPEGMTAQIDKLRSLRRPGIQVSVMERTGTYVPGNSGVAAATFARHCGNLEAALYCYGIPTEQVTPQKWMKHFGALPKEKKLRKHAIRELMARRYPHLTMTLKTADALALFTYYMETKGTE
jgi:hypothetical protein